MSSQWKRESFENKENTLILLRKVFPKREKEFFVLLFCFCAKGNEFSQLVASFGVQAGDETARKEQAGAVRALETEQYRTRMAEEEKARAMLKSSHEQLKKGKRSLAVSTDRARQIAGQLVMAEETSMSNYVGVGIYWVYIKSGGLTKFVFMCLFLALSCVATFIPGLWIGYWSVLYIGYDNAFYAGILAIIVAAEIVFYFLGSVIGMAHGRVASAKIHSEYLDRLGHALISFYDRTPIGRIMNRLAKDMDDIDSMMSFQLQQYARNTSQVLAVIALIGYASPWLLLAFFPLVVLFWLYLRFYRRTSVRLQRIEAVTLSPIFQHFAETLPGLSVIRAFGVSEVERNKSNTYINADSLAEFAARTVDTWLGIRLDFICALCTLAVVYIMVGLRSTLNPVVAGFSINYVLAAVNVLAFFSQNITQLETMMNAVERMKMFGAQIPAEAPFEIPETKPPPEWPQTGRIEFDHVSFTYREGLPLVLDDLSFVIEGGQKVGIVGRTGAGKSSLLVVLLRMAELTGGAVIIDGVDISKIGLHDLRSRVAIIPQDPTLFTGTVRSNLDPFNQYTNEQVWEVLALSQMKAAVERDGGLETVVQEDGKNFSLGQRQLLCMARALLRRPRILLMDEATASVDMENDALIQNTVRSEFRLSTVATVAHRLHTVADSDIVMVLDKGKMAEMDVPVKLVDREKSHFKSLIEASGNATSKHLMEFIRGLEKQLLFLLFFLKRFVFS
jgi:ATP-binding cassette subfamily C (CFTR/MRP) protein 1